ncbi:MAG: hypothetical protein PVJ57_12075 [Phycisphaerae bacterium]|jgi:hypothetical protein
MSVHTVVGTALRLTRRTVIVLLFLAALATLGTGIVSYWQGIPGDTLWINTEDEQPRVYVAMIRGDLHAVYSRPSNAGASRYRQDLGPFMYKHVGIGSIDAVGVSLPFWSLFAVLLFIPLLAFVSGPVRRWRWRRQGRCLHCGYNLTGLAELRCPECGQPFKPRSASATADKQ